MWGGKNVGGGQSVWFWRITLFYLEKRLSKYKMTIFSKKLGVYGPFAPPAAPIVIKPKFVTETLQWSGERKCKVVSIKPNLQANWTCNAITSLLLNGAFVRRTTDLEKTVNINWLLIWLSVTTIADAHKGNVWAHDQPSALWHNTQKKQTSQRATHASAKVSPKS